jgi:hypothetical protein
VRRDKPSLSRDEARRTLSARRELGKGDGNFPDPEPERHALDELPRDRTPRDLPKKRDPRSAPKLAGSPRAQRQRNVDLVLRDEHQASRPRPQTGLERAQQAADAVRSAKRAKPPKRPTARRSSAAKREALRRATKRGT